MTSPPPPILDDQTHRGPDFALHDDGRIRSGGWLPLAIRRIPPWLWAATVAVILLLLAALVVLWLVWLNTPATDPGPKQPTPSGTTEPTATPTDPSTDPSADSSSPSPNPSEGNDGSGPKPSSSLTSPDGPGKPAPGKNTGTRNPHKDV